MAKEKYVFTKQDKKEAKEVANVIHLLLKHSPIEGFSYNETQTGHEVKIKRIGSTELVFKYKRKKF